MCENLRWSTSVRLGQLQPHLGIRWQQVQGQQKSVNHGLLRKMGHHYGGHLNRGRANSLRPCLLEKISVQLQGFLFLV